MYQVLWTPQQLMVAQSSEYEDEMLRERDYQFIIALNLKTVSEALFSECWKLKAVFMPNVTEIGDCAFQNCTSLKNTTGKEFKLNKLKKTGKWSFKGCTSLKIVEFPMLKFVGENCFEECCNIIYDEKQQ